MFAYILYIRIEFALWSIEQIKCILLESGLKCQWYLDSLVMNLLALHRAIAVIAFSHYSTTNLLLYTFQIFSSNLSKPITRGGIKWSLCRSNSLGTSHSTQGRDDSSSTAGLHCTVLYSTIYRCAAHCDRYFNKIW